MTLHQDIKNEATEALKARDAVRLSVLRGLLSSFTNEAVSKGRKPDEELADEEVMTLVGRAVKQRKDSIEQFRKGGREDLVEAEEAELTILESYLPEQMSYDEVEGYVKKKMQEVSVDESKKGQFIGMIMKDLKGKVDGKVVKDVVDNLL